MVLICVFSAFEASSSRMKVDVNCEGQPPEREEPLFRA